MKGKVKESIWLAAAAAAVLGLLAVTVISMRAMNSLPIPVKAPLFVFMQWIPLAAAAVIMLIRRESIKELLPPKEKAGRQIVLGIVCGFLMSVVLMLIPFAAGFKEYIYTNGGYGNIFNALYKLASYIIGTAAAEEILFRGYFFSRIERLGGETAAIIGSSLLFGLYHIMNGNIVQVIFTTVIGLIFCITRKKVKGFTLLSLIFMHGIYDFMIPVWAGLF